MLARTVDARATRDIDLLSKKDSLDAAVEELKRLATVDLDDFATFEFLRATPIKTEDEYRMGSMCASGASWEPNPFRMSPSTWSSTRSLWRTSMS